MASRTRYIDENADRTLARVREKARYRAGEIADFIHDQIKRLAPRDPLHYKNTPEGRPLADSFSVEYDKATGDFLISSSAYYWVFVEYGTLAHGGPEKTDAQPFVRPALDLAKAKFR